MAWNVTNFGFIQQEKVDQWFRTEVSNDLDPSSDSTQSNIVFYFLKMYRDKQSIFIETDTNINVFLINRLLLSSVCSFINFI